VCTVVRKYKKQGCHRRFFFVFLFPRWLSQIFLKNPFAPHLRARHNTVHIYIFVYYCITRPTSITFDILITKIKMFCRPANVLAFSAKLLFTSSDRQEICPQAWIATPERHNDTAFSNELAMPFGPTGRGYDFTSSRCLPVKLNSHV
jgi:hypothetical protein